MNGGAGRAIVHGVTNSRTRLRDWARGGHLTSFSASFAHSVSGDEINSSPTSTELECESDGITDLKSLHRAMWVFASPKRKTAFKRVDVAVSRGNQDRESWRWPAPSVLHPASPPLCSGRSQIFRPCWWGAGEIWSLALSCGALGFPSHWPERPPSLFCFLRGEPYTSKFKTTMKWVSSRLGDGQLEFWWGPR